MKFVTKILKSMAVVSVLAVSAPATAVDVPGHVVYKMPSGELVTRDVTLDVPPRGQGKVIWKSGDVRLESHAFKTTKANGRTTFSVLFLDPPGAPKNTAFAITGAYMRGTNKVIYYGDIWSKQYDALSDSMASELEKSLDDVVAGEGSDWSYSGGFMFTK